LARILNIALLLALLVAPIVAGYMGKPFWFDVFTRIVILAIVASSLYLLLGVAGLASFGHAAFLGIGAYSVGIPAYHAIYGGAEWLASNNGWWHLLLAMIVSALFALVTGAISLRTRGVHFIMITMAFSQMVYYGLISLESYGGDDGLSIDLASEFYGLNLEDPLSLYLTCYISLLVVLFILYRLSNSHFGRVLSAAKQNESLTNALGVNPFRYQLLAYVIAGMIGAYAGVLSANYSLFISPGMIEWTRSGELLFMVILGGVASVFGPLIGATVFIFLEWILSRFTVFWHLPFGLILLTVVLFARGGISGLFQRDKA